MKTLFSKMGLFPMFFTIQFCIAIFHQCLIHEGWSSFVTITWTALLLFLSTVFGKRLLTYNPKQYEN